MEELILKLTVILGAIGGFVFACFHAVQTWNDEDEESYMIVVYFLGMPIAGVFVSMLALMFSPILILALPIWLIRRRQFKRREA